MKKYEFTYIIKQLDLENGGILIEYIPINKLITKFTFNIPLCVYTEDTNELKTLIESISDCAPHHLWETQEMLLEHGDNILNFTGTINPNA